MATRFADQPLRALIRQLVTRLRTASDVRATGHTASALLHEAVANFNPSTLATVPEKTASLLAFIAKNPEATLSNAALAKHVGLSEGAFIRWFHAEVGTTPAVHVQQMRMKTADKSSKIIVKCSTLCQWTLFLVSRRLTVMQWQPCFTSTLHWPPSFLFSTARSTPSGRHITTSPFMSTRF